MIVCLCHGVSERTLEKIIDEGADCLKAVERQCGAGGDCGSCRFQIAKMISEKTEDTSSETWPLPLLQTG
jgi:bacterioferritin-associated ferredoxin